MYLSVTNINVELLSPFHYQKSKCFNGFYNIIFTWIAVNDGAAACKVYLHTLNTGNLLDCSLYIALAMVAVHSFYHNGPRCDVASPTTACILLTLAVSLNECICKQQGKQNGADCVEI